MLPRFFVPDAGRSVGDTVVALPEEESTHLIRVLRLRAGATVRVFNGRGREWRAEVAAADRKVATVKLVEAVDPAHEPRIPITLGLAVLKGDKMDDVVRDVVMLGASAIQPLLTDRSETSAAALSRGHRIDRWKRVAVSSAKQCGRAVVPDVADVLSFAKWIAIQRREPMLMLVEPSAKAFTLPLRRVMPVPRATLIVGPEGGWTDGEIRAAQDARAALVTLGTLTLRADRAPIVALTALRAVWEDF